MKKLSFVFAAILFFMTQATFAADQIVRPYQSLRSSSMGGVRIMTGLYDENFFGNPARATANPIWKIQVFDLMVESTPDTVDAVQDLLGSGDTFKKISSKMGKNLHGRVQTTFPGVYIPGEKNSYAFALLTSTQFDVNLRRSYQADTLAISDIGPAFTFARKFLKDDALSIGVTPHLTYRIASKEGFSLVDLIKGESPSPAKSGGDGTHFEIDLGGTYHFVNAKPLGLDVKTGASVNNIMGGTYGNVPFNILKDNKNRPRQQPRTYNVGVSLSKDVLVWKLTNPILSFEVTDIGNNTNGSIFRLLHLGGEFKFGVLIPRFGINQGYLCGGFALNLKFFELELGTYGEEMSLNAGEMEDRRVALRLALQI